MEAVIYCDASVATPLHRAVAGALDSSMVLIGYGLFLLTFYLFGGEFDLTRNNLMIFGGALLLLGFTYGLFWAIAGTESAGMRWMRLRLITFDGAQPDFRQRLVRFAGSCLSVGSALVCFGVWPTRRLSPGRTTSRAPSRRRTNWNRAYSAAGSSGLPAAAHRFNVLLP